MIGIGIECGFGSAKIAFDRCCGQVMSHLFRVRDAPVVLSIVFASPSSPLPRDLSEMKVMRLNRRKPLLSVVVPVPDEATTWTVQEALKFIQASSYAAIDLATEKLGNVVSRNKLCTMVDEFDTVLE